MADKNVNLYGKISHFKNTKAHKAYNFLENIKVSKNKLWYILVENQLDSANELKLIKFNNQAGVNLNTFVNNLKEFYIKSENQKISESVKNLEVIGESNFSIIKNIPDVLIDGKKLLTIITEDLIKLLK